MLCLITLSTYASTTPTGADASSNADHSIPSWAGQYLGAPPHIQYEAGDYYPDPYADEAPLFIINHGNLHEHKSFLSEGLIALIEQYPSNFTIPVYPSHRDFAYNPLIIERSQWNTINSQLTQNTYALTNYNGGFPFILANTPEEMMWNTLSNHHAPTHNGVFEFIAHEAGKTQRFQYELLTEFPTAMADNETGADTQRVDINYLYGLITFTYPESLEGMKVLLHEPYDKTRYDTKFWTYAPGIKRVKRSPDFTEDYSLSESFNVTDLNGFNGNIADYEWVFIKSQDMYIPYHNYAFDQQALPFDQLLLAHHASPQFMRYEKHRVYVIEAYAKPDSNSPYSKRRFYIDEDSWHIVLTESFDASGNLWRAGIQNTVYAYDAQIYIRRALQQHDLQSGDFSVIGLINQTQAIELMAEPKGQEYFSIRTCSKTMGTR